MQRNAAQLIVDLGDILSDRVLPDIREASVSLGDFNDRIPLSVLRKHFNDIKVAFTALDKSYALLHCKMSAESLLTFNARVAGSELKLVTKTVEAYEIPSSDETESEAPDLPIVREEAEAELSDLSLEEVPSQDEESEILHVENPTA